MNENNLNNLNDLQKANLIRFIENLESGRFTQNYGSYVEYGDVFPLQLHCCALGLGLVTIAGLEKELKRKRSFPKAK
jgi:hypothetical protein